MDRKQCITCKQELPKEDFYKSNLSKDGLRHQCKRCGNTYQRSEGYKKYRRKKYKENYSEKRIRGRRAEAKYRERNKDKLKKKYQKWFIQWRYGITLDDYNKLFISQSGRCAICGKHQTEMTKKLGVDHCHLTNKVRGLLCDKCNLIVGHVENNQGLLSEIEKYLKERTV